jgi:hypothetical protein
MQWIVEHELHKLGLSFRPRQQKSYDLEVRRNEVEAHSGQHSSKGHWQN